MDGVYYFIFNKIKYIVLRTFTIQVLYIFVLLQVLPQFININNYNILIPILLLVVMYKFIELVINYFQIYPKIFLGISTVILFSLLVLANFKKYDIAKYMNFQRQAFIINKFEFFSILPIIGLVMLIILILYFMFIEKIYFFVTPFFCMILLTLVWNAGAEDKYESSIIIFIFTFFMDLLLHYYDKSKTGSLKEKLAFGVHKKSIFRYGTILICIMLLFSVGLASLTGTKSLDQIRRDKIAKKINNLNAPLFDSLQSRLGGSLKLDDKILFKIKGEPPKYLIGSIKSNYDGTAWIKDNGDYFNKSSKPFYKNNNFKTLMGESKNQKLKLNSIEITPVNANWKTLFVPNNIYNITTKENDIVYNRSYCFVNLSNTTKESYTIEYYKSYTNIESINSANKEYLSYDTNSSLIKGNYRDYLELPENITERTKNLVNEITKNCKNNTEKVLAIRNYLLTNYGYKTNVSEVAEGKEFVDNFLFEEKSGYCTYFATACTIMLRIAGIPSRYAEGYYVDASNLKDGYYNVLENNGHAFAEVLLSPDADIWSVVESTPGYSTEKSNYIPYYARNINNIYNDIKGKVVNKQKNSVSSKANSQVDLKLNPIYIILLSILVLVSASIFYLLITGYKKKQYILRSKSNICFYQYLRYRLNSIGFMVNVSEPDLVEVSKIYDNELRNLVTPIVEGYYREFYGEETVLMDKKQIYCKFEEYMRKKQSLVVYCWNKIKAIMEWRPYKL